MNSTLNHPGLNENKTNPAHAYSTKSLATSKIKNINSDNQLLLPNRIINHHPHAGINTIVDAASYLFSVMGKLKQIKSYRHLNKLHLELVQEINAFYETIKNHNYPTEYSMICRYVLCNTLDDIIINTPWGGQGLWEDYSLLAAFNQNNQNHDKFFNIIDYAIKEPDKYIDLMELSYLCLSMGYKGYYGSTAQHSHQLEQITNNLYKHIRAYRGNFSKNLSNTTPDHSSVLTISSQKSSFLIIFIITACVMMTLFVSLGYIMELISNEAYQNFTAMENSIIHKTSR